MRQGQAVFANFICKFGSHGLAAYLDQIVLPAFLTKNPVRKWGQTSYHLIGVVAEDIDVDGLARPVVHGRFVKDTVLTRTQVLLPTGDTRSDRRSMQSSPSAFLVLFLDDHRLIYYAETANAPELRAFRSVAQYFLREAWAGFVENFYQSDGTMSRVQVSELHPRPNVSIVPIASGESIRDFISRYSIITRLEIDVLQRNDEIDYSSLMEGLRQFGDEIGSPVTKILDKKATGLKQDKVADALESISKQGNQNFLVSGKDKEGNDLAGDNADFSLKVHVSALPDDRRQKASVLAGKLSDAVRRGIVVLPSVGSDIRSRISRTVRNFSL